MKKSIFLYVNYTPEDISIGITKKINAQIQTLRKMGYDVTYTAYTPLGAAIYDNNDEVIYSTNKQSFKNAKIKRYLRRFVLINTATNYLKSCGKSFDYAYLRWHTFDRIYLKMLAQLKKSGAKIIVEAHAFSSDMKATSLISFYTMKMDNIYSKYAKKYVDLIAGISDEENIWGIKTVKIDNAIMLDNIQERHWAPEQNDTLRIVSVSNEREYHGYDRLLKGLYNYYQNGGKRNIIVKFVGVFRTKTVELTKELGLDDRVIFYGKKSGAELDKIYDESDLGIGALAHHRIGLYAGSSLKTKEYFAKGLPFIYGWDEPAFDNTYPYAMQIKLNKEPIDINAVLEFYDGIKNDKNMLSSMREFARENYSWTTQFEKIFNAL